jgi:dihydrofolate synthase/folylpolyglutamate synthase
VNDKYAAWTVKAGGDETVEIETTVHLYPHIKLGLAGRHQAENAETALRAVQCLRYDNGIEIDDQDIVAGLENARHPGRLERIGQFLLDGAHNISGARALRAYLDDLGQRSIVMIFAAMEGKDVREMLAELVPAVDTVVLTRPSNSRALGPAAIESSLPASDHLKVYHAANARDAVLQAESIAFEDTVILVTGSLYLVGEVKELLENRRAFEI